MTDDETDRDDPFEDLETAVGERDGDPFEHLDPAESPRERAPDIDADEPTKPDREHGDGNRGSSGTERSQGSEGRRSESDQGSEKRGSKSADDTEMDVGIGRRETDRLEDMPSLSDVGKREGDPFERFDDVFDEQEVDQLDPDEVWQDLTSAESRGSVGDATERTYAEVSKHSYCEQCEYFSEPPEAHCTHEGTEIVEFLDMETVRVVDCPVVTEREKLEEGSHGKD